MREVVVGEVAAVLVDARRARVIGLDIVDPDGVHRFLPWVVADLGADGVSVRSSFLLVDESDLYTRLRAQQIADPAELAGLHVDRSGRLVGETVTVSTVPAAGTSVG